MNMVSVRGTAGKRALSEYLRAGLPDSWRISPEGRDEPALTVLFTDVPLDRLEPEEWTAGNMADIVLVERGDDFAGESELGLERVFKDATGAGKVLIFSDEEARERAFRKVMDLALSRTGGSDMPEDIPEKVVDAVKREAVDNRIECERAQELAGELGVPIPVVGRALDLLGIKITRCQLGCF